MHYSLLSTDNTNFGTASYDWLGITYRYSVISFRFHTKISIHNHYHIICVPVRKSSLFQLSSFIFIAGNDISSVPALATAHTMPPTTPASATATLPTTFVTSTATLRPAKLSICETDVEHFISDHGKESSISLDLEPHRMVSHRGPCRVTLTAPEPFGFVVKLVRTKTKLQRNLATTTLVPASSPVTAPLYSTRAAIGSRGGRTANASIGATENRTTSCPLKIVSF